MNHSTLLPHVGLIAAAIAGFAAFVPSSSLDVSRTWNAAPDALSAHEELRAELLAQLSEDEKGGAVTPDTLLIASLGEERLLAGAALPKSDDDGTLGMLIVRGPSAHPVPAGLYSLRAEGSGMTIQIVDHTERVVQTVSIDPPLDQGAQAIGPWTRTFFTLARNLGPKLN